jgi:polyribonucleotide nucleotidyltransferase
MFKEIKKTLELNGKILELSTGKIARQADGAVVVKMGDTILLCTAVCAKEAKEGIDFFPLTVHYKEMAFAVGKIPSGFVKREGRASERETLVSRLIDRPIRPLFHKSFVNETQVICTVLSFDPTTCTEILAIIGASAALALSGAPYESIIAASKVGMIDGKFILNPSCEELKNSILELVVAGTKDSIMMVESEANLLSESDMLNALKFGQEAFIPIITIIEELKQEAGKSQIEVSDLYPEELKKKIENIISDDIKTAFAIKEKQLRNIALHNVEVKILEYFAKDIANGSLNALQLHMALKIVTSDVLRYDILHNHKRIDGRDLVSIRPIETEIAILPRTHGSALFTRGETQSLVVATLGTNSDEQIVDSLDGEYKENFMLNYIFPPYSVGETTPVRAPGRREIGHGKLAWRAIKCLLEPFPYSIRIVSEITESNGSSSMATVCGASMALMDAGVPIKEAVAGIAMGLIMEKDKYCILSDIIGDEDHLGDMDFKVAGTKTGITALQMDIKVKGINLDIMAKALDQAKKGRLHILNEMSKTISSSKLEISPYAPSIISFKIDKDKIRDIIGPGGKIIREICDTTSSKIDISDDGIVTISAIGRDKLNDAVDRVKSIAFEPEVGGIFKGPVVKIIESGAFINYIGNRDGFVHISEIAHERIESVHSILKEGDIVKVKLVSFDNKGRAKLSIKDTIDKPESDEVQQKNQTQVTATPAPRETAKKWNKPAVTNSEPIVTERKYFN